MTVMRKFDFKRYYGSAKVRTRVEYALVKSVEGEKTVRQLFTASKGQYQS